jgi:hypothetical protein
MIRVKELRGFKTRVNNYTERGYKLNFLVRQKTKFLVRQETKFFEKTWFLIAHPHL